MTQLAKLSTRYQPLTVELTADVFLTAQFHTSDNVTLKRLGINVRGQRRKIVTIRY